MNLGTPQKFEGMPPILMPQNFQASMMAWPYNGVLAPGTQLITQWPNMAFMAQAQPQLQQQQQQQLMNHQHQSVLQSKATNGNGQDVAASSLLNLGAQGSLSNQVFAEQQKKLLIQTRKNMYALTLTLLYQREAVSKRWSRKEASVLEALAHSIDERLFTEAKTVEHYANVSTLKLRIMDLASKTYSIAKPKAGEVLCRKDRTVESEVPESPSSKRRKVERNSGEAWQCPEKDERLRASIIRAISFLFSAKLWPAQQVEHIPALAAALEKVLYDNARTQEEYRCIVTLKERIMAIARKVHLRAIKAGRPR